MGLLQIQAFVGELEGFDGDFAGLGVEVRSLPLAGPGGNEIDPGDFGAVVGEDDDGAVAAQSQTTPSRPAALPAREISATCATFWIAATRYEMNECCSPCAST